MNVCDWVAELQDRLEVVRDVLRDKMKVAKEKEKVEYDITTKLRKFEPGDMVLIRIPGLEEKLEDSWDDPYEVLKSLSDVNYQVSIPKFRGKTKILHVNNLKPWVEQRGKVLRIIAVAEDVMTEEEKLKLVGEPLTADQTTEIDEILLEFKDILVNTPGHTNIAVHAIDTGNHQPIHTLPYTLCPAWRQQVKEEISYLISAGIKESCVSPWSSPIVPIKKPDGSIRLCIVYRKVNSVTTPDPFYIPLIDDILDNVGECKYLSKLDLSKGFYQVPIKESDEDKTALCNPFGKFRFLRMPFGLMNAPSTFQRMMPTVLEGQEKYSSLYIDYVLFIQGHGRNMYNTLDRS